MVHSLSKTAVVDESHDQENRAILPPVVSSFSSVSICDFIARFNFRSRDFTLAGAGEVFSLRLFIAPNYLFFWF